MPLTDVACRTAKPCERQLKLADGGGPYLLVRPGGAKLWQMADRFAGNEKTLFFGQYPAVTLIEARGRSPS